MALSYPKLKTDLNLDFLATLSLQFHAELLTASSLYFTGLPRLPQRWADRICLCPLSWAEQGSPACSPREAPRWAQNTSQEHTGMATHTRAGAKPPVPAAA